MGGAAGWCVGILLAATFADEPRVAGDTPVERMLGEVRAADERASAELNALSVAMGQGPQPIPEAMQ